MGAMDLLGIHSHRIAPPINVNSGLARIYRSKLLSGVACLCCALQKFESRKTAVETREHSRQCPVLGCGINVVITNYRFIAAVAGECFEYWNLSTIGMIPYYHAFNYIVHLSSLFLFRQNPRITRLDHLT